MPVRFKSALVAVSALMITCLATRADAQTATPAAQEAACDANDAEACTALALRLTRGTGVAKDEKRGADMFLKACNLDNGRACMQWGYALEAGRGASIDLPQSASYYEKSCKLGHSTGCNNHGQMLRYGRGVVKNEALALTNFTKSCNMGFGQGCRNQGALLRDAITISKDMTLSTAAFEKGCALNDYESCNRQGWHTEMGTGTPRDVDKAVQLYNKACLGGFQIGCDNAKVFANRRPEPLTTSPATSQVSTASSAAGATPANPAVGPMVCSAFMTEGNKMFLAWGFSAAGTRSVELAQAYAQMLREKGYAAASMYAPAGSPPPALTVDCRWHETQGKAAGFKDELIAGAERNRITYVPTTFNPS